MGRLALRPVGRLFVASVSLAVLLVGAGSAQAFPTGIDSSNFGPLGCNQCHSGGVDPQVLLAANTTVPAAGETITLTFTVASQSPLQTHAGFNLRADRSGTFAVSGGLGSLATRTVMNDVTGMLEGTHTMPKPAIGSPGLTIFS